MSWTCSPASLPSLSAITLLNLSVQSSPWAQGPWSVGYGFSPSSSNKCPLIGTKLTKWYASPEKKIYEFLHKQVYFTIVRNMTKLSIKFEKKISQLFLPVKRPVETPAFLSVFFRTCGIACELWAQASSGVLPIAQPLFSGFIHSVWCCKWKFLYKNCMVTIVHRMNKIWLNTLSLLSVSPKCRLGQFSNIDSKACVAQLLGTICCAKKMLLIVSSSRT